MSLSTKIAGLQSLMQFDNKLQLILSLTLFRSNPLDVYCLRGKQILVDNSADDENGTRAAIISPMYKQFLPQMTLPDQVNVLDFGANGGGFTLMLELNGISIRKVACIEFNPNTYSRMRFNVERNIQGEFIGFNAAVCGQKQEFEMTLGAGGTSDNIYEQRTGQGTRRFKIQGLTFDDIFATAFGDERVDICKLDVEAAEYEICSTPFHQSLKKCSYLIIEIHPHPTKEKSFVLDELKSCGFEVICRDPATDQDIYLLKNTHLITV